MILQLFLVLLLVEVGLRRSQQALENEKGNRKWWAGGGVTVGVVATIIVMWMMN